jgi:hypothetical protein
MSETSNSSFNQKYLTYILGAVIVLGGIVWYVSSEKSREKAVEQELASAKSELAAQKKKAEVSAEIMGKKSSAVYNNYMKSVLTSRFIALKIRKVVEQLQTIRLQQGAGATFGLDARAGLRESIGYLDAAVKASSSIDLSGVDSDLVAFVRKNLDLDSAEKKVYEDYASTGRKPDEELVTIASRRERLVDNEEAKLISKFNSLYNINLPSSSQLQGEVEGKLLKDSEVFAKDLTVEHVAQGMIGSRLTNYQNNTIWTLGAAQCVGGSFVLKKAIPGCVMAQVQIQVKDAAKNTGLLSALVVYAKPADANILDWVLVLRVVDPK